MSNSTLAATASCWPLREFLPPPSELVRVLDLPKAWGVLYSNYGIMCKGRRRSDKPVPSRSEARAQPPSEGERIEGRWRRHTHVYEIPRRGKLRLRRFRS